MSTSRSSEKRLKTIEVYTSENQSRSKALGLRLFLQTQFPTVAVNILPPILKGSGSDEMDVLAEELASARVKDISSAVQSFEAMFGEIDYERRTILGKAKVGGIVYDGRMLEEIIVRHGLIRQSLDTASIIVTDRLISTYSRDDLRHHLRTVLCGFPSVISLPGIVEAPAKPREYYLMKTQLGGAGEMQAEKLKRYFKGRFLDYGDRRIPEVINGLALQAVLFHLTLEPFCEDPACRLFNAHWQEDLIRTQVTSHKMCARHGRLLEKLAEDSVLRW